jgi:multiple sugar transport system permease protein/putative aldouronate transport system permease protein
MAYSGVAIFAIFCLIPLWTLIIASFTENNTLIREGFGLWTTNWSLAAYEHILKGNEIRIAYGVSLFVTIFGTISSIFVMSGLAYMLSVRHFKGRNRLAFYVYFTMILSGGIIPWFITMRMLGLMNNIWALIVPMLVNPWWVLVMRNFFGQLPGEIIESARIDGASDVQVLFKVVLPLSLPALATVGLFVAVAYWNDWWHGVMLLPLAEFRPLAVLLLQINRLIMSIQEAIRQGGANVPIVDLPSISIRMATTVVTIGPIILVYPFVQRFFIQGLVVGGIKG